MSTRLLRGVPRLPLGVVLIVAFATADAVVKGHHGGVRNAVGNVSALWAVIPFLAGVFLTRVRVILAAAIGAASVVLTLTAYSVVRAIEGSTQYGHHATMNALLSSTSNRWFLLGVVGGAALGAIGAHLACRRSWDIVVVVVGSLLILEPATRVLWALARGEPARTLVPVPLIWVLEIACGCAVITVFHLRAVSLESRGE